MNKNINLDIHIKVEGEFQPALSLGWELVDPEKIGLYLHPKNEDPVDCVGISLMKEDVEHLISALQSCLTYVKEAPKDSK